MTALVHVALFAGAFLAGYVVASVRWRRVLLRHRDDIRRIGRR